MADPPTITLTPDDLPAFRAAVIACTDAAERDRCERLLGQLASLESHAAGGDLRFVPGPRTAPLARRALAALEEARRRPGD